MSRSWERESKVTRKSPLPSGRSRGIGLVRRGAPGRAEVALRVRDHAAKVATLEEVGANERTAHAESTDACAQVVRDLFQVDVARRGARPGHESAPHARRENRTADCRSRDNIGDA